MNWTTLGGGSKYSYSFTLLFAIGSRLTGIRIRVDMFYEDETQYRKKRVFFSLFVYSIAAVNALSI